MLTLDADTMIVEGLHQHQTGRIVNIDTTTTIPFATVRRYGVDGKLLKTRFALVPLKYCAPLDEAARALVAEVRADQLEQRRMEKARMASNAAALVAHMSRARALTGA